MLPLITTVFVLKYAQNFKTPPCCQSCQLACSPCLVSKLNKLTKACNDHARAQNGYEACNYVSADQHICQHSRQIIVYGQEAPYNHFNGKNRFHNNATGLI